ncbi:pyridoxamine 5'-phosphate oxidase family protein [Amycolatopsis sp. K13G38]|uniref:Pyridoxamine 5'-phosphate oxidase family protein n=1 Tax=Amycolatopsis acididurans TaxID=2724524 RepID=A0ABX1J5F2_9PSEU|nr:pyridoxamine 5'-phosphate oxidase family protein [Amycolatopsis acididurans]NKQ54973.1 pyridoxamine 5'-phosphate oxidase family protein [Amycolatopsis acididurans]
MPTKAYDLPEQECVRLVRSKHVGRLVYAERGLPVVRLAEFVIVDENVVIHGQVGPWLDRLDGAVVAFEVDHVNTATHTGWCVVIVGRARRAETADDSYERHCSIDMGQISGHRVRFPARPVQ